MEKNRKRLAALCTICFFIIIIIVARQYASRLSLFQPKALLAFSDNDISRIVLTAPNRNQTLLRKNGTWVIPINGVDFQADTDKIGSLLKTLHGITADTVVSRNKSKFADFGIGTSEIVLETKNNKYALYVGSTSFGDNAYARLDNQDTVFDAANLGTVYLDTDYRNLHVPIVGNAADVQSLRIDYDGETTVLTKAGNTWHNGEDVPVADTAVDTYLQNMANLQAEDIKPHTATPNGDLQLTVTVNEKSKEKTVRFYSAGEQKIDAGITGSSFVYKLPEVYVASLEKKGADFTRSTEQP